jgi:hypothetical protein
MSVVDVTTRIFNFPRPGGSDFMLIFGACGGVCFPMFGGSGCSGAVLGTLGLATCYFPVSEVRYLELQSDLGMRPSG